MDLNAKRFNEFLIGDYYVITGENHDLWKIMPLLYANGYHLFYHSKILLIDLSSIDD